MTATTAVFTVICARAARIEAGLAMVGKDRFLHRSTFESLRGRTTVF